MAEFQEVMKQKNRMCNSYSLCTNCPIYENDNKGEMLCDDFIICKPAIAEEIIMKWASEHPEPCYPTWAEWQKNMFPEGRICPKCFTSREKAHCDTFDSCNECRKQRIPADIAEKLGIKPVEGGKINA